MNFMAPQTNISEPYLKRLATVYDNQDVASQTIREMASELLSLRQQIGQRQAELEFIMQKNMEAAKQEPAQSVPSGYRLQSMAEFDAMNEWIASNDDLTIAYMSGKHDQKAIDHDKKQKALHFVRWIASLKTGGLIQARANDLLRLLEAGNE